MWRNAGLGFIMGRLERTMLKIVSIGKQVVIIRYIIAAVELRDTPA